MILRSFTDLPRGIVPPGLALTLLLAPSTAQCSDPTPPPGGFAVTTVADRIVTYADGARTMIDVRHPGAAAGPCGWPVVIVVHGLGGTRAGPAPMATTLAKRGYLTAAYDVRGQGYAASVNPPSLGSTAIGKDERLDLAEIVAWIDGTFGGAGSGIADVTRLGITGYSQGAAHSWAAAAWSGRTLPPNSRGITTFPVFSAAYPQAMSTVDGPFVVPQGRALMQRGVEALSTSSPSVVWNPSFQSQAINLMSAGDFAGVAALFDNDVWRRDRQKLATSIVPIMVHAQWNDRWVPIDRVIGTINALPATTPTRALLSAMGGHQEPRNDRQWDLSTLSAQRWFDRFLKNIQNQVEREPRFVAGIVAETEGEYRNHTSLLWNRYSAIWPPAASSTTTRGYYLRWNRLLDPNPPTAPENTRRVRHTVNAGASLSAFVAQGAGADLITSWFPLYEQVYTTAVQSSAIEIVGSPRAVLEVTPDGPDFQLHCALYQVHANGTERYLQSGVALVRGNGDAQQVVVDFHDIHALILAGERLRLKVQNLTRRYPAGLAIGAFNYFTVPYFQDVDVRIEHSPRVSKLEILVADVIRPALTSKTQFYDTLQPTDVTFALESTPAYAGRTYFVLFGVTGIAPGFPVPGGGHAWLNVDPLTTDLLPLINSSFLPNCAGVLDASGSASPSPRVRLSTIAGLQALVGLRMTALGAVVPTGGGFLVTNPVDWVFQ